MFVTPSYLNTLPVQSLHGITTTSARAPDIWQVTNTQDKETDAKMEEKEEDLAALCFVIICRFAQVH